MSTVVIIHRNESNELTIKAISPDGSDESVAAALRSAADQLDPPQS